MWAHAEAPLLRYQPYDGSSMKVNVFGTWERLLGKGVEEEKEREQRGTERRRREKGGKKLARTTWGERLGWGWEQSFVIALI